ncbi:MAG TPA: GNAT family N-acetyltransferase [Acidobacteriaceae bacterium]|nr:GNAT family N-acetyltransferase [Acidobacteriaceae bacterium]
MALIREATDQDASAIAHVHVKSWLTTYAGIVPEDYLASLNEAERTLVWRDWLARDIHSYVAELDGRVVGFVCGGQIREPLPGCDAELFAIYLLDRAQGRGLGTALLRTLADSLKAKGFKSMAVWVLERNPARHFYQKSGASLVAAKEIEIGGVLLREVAFAWPDLAKIPLPLSFSPRKAASPKR